MKKQENNTIEQPKQVYIAKASVMHDGKKLHHTFAIEDWEAPIHTGYIMSSGHILCSKCCSVAVARIGLSVVGLSSSNTEVHCENQKCQEVK